MNKFYTVVLCSVLCCCANDPISTAPTNNKDVQVSFLFEHDGVKVYRFYDNGTYIYYADARGSTMRNITNDDSTTHQTVQTVK